MKHARATEEQQARIALYALGAMTHHEAQSIELHLREGCGVCGALRSHFAKIVAGIGLGVEEAAPPSYLCDLLAARIEREMRTPPPEPAPAERPVLELRHAPAFRLPMAPPPRRSPFPWLVAAALALASAYLAYSWHQARESAILAQARLDDARIDLDLRLAADDEQRARARELEEIQTALTDPGVKLIRLVGQDPTLSASAAVFWDTQRSRWTFTGFFPLASVGRDYQLWYLTPKGPVGAGVVKTDGRGHCFAVMDLPLDLTGVSGAMLTLEPEGGSPQPSGPVCAQGTIP